MLAFLALDSGAPQSRERLAGLFWSDSDDARARDSLKHALARLKAVLGDAGEAVLQADRHAVRLSADEIRFDVRDFEGLVRRGSRAQLERALDLYAGDFLEGVSLGGAEAEDWLLAERRRLRRIAEQAATSLVATFGNGQDLAEGESAARRALRLDPLNEPAYRLLMKVKASSGDTVQALRVFSEFRALLDRELAVAPEPETVALHDAIRASRVPPREAPRSRADAKPGLATAEPTPPSTRPSIAVLAFETLGDDARRDYFADGVVEEIIAALSRVRGLFVIARNSSFAFRGRSADSKSVGEALGARYLLRGSARQDARNVRITATLIDSIAGTVIWSDSFQGALTRVFELQDRIAGRVVGALLPRVEAAEIARAFRKPTESLDAYDLYLRGLAAMHLWTEEGSAEAISLFRRASELDPDFAAAYGMAVRCYSQRKACGWVRNRAEETAEVARLARLAADCGPDDALALATAGIGFGFVVGDPAKGARLVERALELNPNLALAWLFSGWIQVWLGRPDLAIGHIERAMGLSPQDPQYAMMQAATGCAHFFAGREREAVDWAERAVLMQPNYWIAWCVLSAGRAALGDVAGAGLALDHVLRIDPGLRLSNLDAAFPIAGAAEIAKWKGAMRIAGLPE
ncbi:BTAD domain-containing putative transcriptional regulator [Amaricoccus sp.]|nr:BTAD domain-containing putative transcriptional regulator [Amaricoccus sp.]HMR61594.1 BTAD domain-containing putative transcriptional regulator [Amaricoccus sp.]